MRVVSNPDWTRVEIRNDISGNCLLFSLTESKFGTYYAPSMPYAASTKKALVLAAITVGEGFAEEELEVLDEWRCDDDDDDDDEEW